MLLNILQSPGQSPPEDYPVSKVNHAAAEKKQQRSKASKVNFLFNPAISLLDITLINCQKHKKK